MSVKEEESEVVLGTARHSLRSLIMTYSWIVIAVMPVHIDRWEPLVAHIERAHCVILPLDRVVELHHRWESDWDWCHVVICISISAAGNRAVWLRMRVWWVDNILRSWILVVCKKWWCSRSVSLKAM